MRRKILSIAAIVAACILPQTITLNGFFIIDDIRAALIGIHPEQFPIFFDPISTISGFFRPMFTAVNRFDGMIWGANPVGYHITNIILFICVALCVLWFLKKRFDGYTAFVSTLIIVAHPIHAGTVAWITGRSDIMPGLFMTLSLLMFFDYRQKWFHLFLAHVLFVIALFAKEVAVVTPFIYMAYLTIVEKKSVGYALRSSSVLLAILSIYVGARISFAYLPRNNFYSPFSTNFNGYIGDALVFAANLVYLFIPFYNPSIFFADLTIGTCERIACIVYLVLCLTCIFAALYFLFRPIRKSDDFRLAAFGAVWIFLVAAPTFHVFRSAGGSRYLFPAMPAMAILIGVIVKTAMKRYGEVRVRRTVMAFIAILALVTVFELIRWKKAMDTAELVVKKTVECAGDDISRLAIYDFPPPKKQIDPFPAFDNYSIPLSYHVLTGKPASKIVMLRNGSREICGRERVRCLSYAELIEGRCGE